jgi:hypothetical protein
LFGMLDYRAHKLYRTICWPFRVMAKIMLFVMAFIAVALSQQTSYPPIVKIGMAYILFEAFGIVTMLLWKLLTHLITKAFFWVIDPVPSRGADAEEARAVALIGPVFWLGKKMEQRIEDWTEEDSRATIACLNWRARYLFSATITERLRRSIRAQQRAFYETGKRLKSYEIAEFVKTAVGGPSWLETALCNQYLFNSVMALALIITSTVVMSPSARRDSGSSAQGDFDACAAQAALRFFLCPNDPVPNASRLLCGSARQQRNPPR